MLQIVSHFLWTIWLKLLIYWDQMQSLLMVFGSPQTTIQTEMPTNASKITDIPRVIGSRLLDQAYD